MKRNILPLVVFGIGAIFFASTSAEAAKVRKILKRAVAVSGVKPDDGFEKGSEVCFFDGDDEEVGCGKVVKILRKGKAVIVKVKSSVKKKIKKGFSARGSGDSSDDSESSGSSSSGSSGQKMKLWIMYSPAIMTPAVYNKLAYKAHPNEAPDTIWEAGETSGSAPTDAIFGFNFAFGIPLGKMTIIPGLRYRSYRSTLVAADQYIDTNPNIFVETQQEGTALGLYGDFAYLNLSFGSSNLGLTAGLDIDMSSTTFTATRKDDAAAPLPDEEFATAESSLTLIGLRLGSNFDFMFASSFGMNFGLNLIIPLAEASNEFSGNVEDTEAPGLADQNEDLKTALSHTKGGVGVEINLGTVIAF